MGDDIDATPFDLDAGVAAQAQAANAPIVVLPLREVEGVGIYPSGTLTLVKRLRSDGVSASYLHDSEHRRFVVKKSALGDVAAFLLGIGSSAAWDAVKALFRRGENSQVEVTYVDLESSGTHLTAWRVAGDRDSVLRAIDSLRSSNITSPSEASFEGPAEQTTFDVAGPDDDLRSEYSRSQIEERRRAADELLAAAKAALSGSSPDREVAEREARSALRLYARSLDWSEDTAAEDDAHRRMDAAGKWVRSTFGCWLDREGTTYKETCPVALAHNRIGLSVGGSARRICSLCGGDLSEREHLTGTAYMVPGGSAALGWCGVCLEEDCEEHSPDQLYRVSVTSMIQELEVDEVSLVDKPAQPEARIIQMSVSTSDLQAALGDEFVPGMEVSCDKCLTPCGGLTKHEPDNGETA